MEFTFAKIEASLASMHSVPAEKRQAFTARLKHMQKLGFPPGANTGKGYSVAYKPEHAVLMALALELIQLGLTPERSINIIYRDIRAICRGISDWVRRPPVDGEQNSKFPVLVLDPAVMSVALNAPNAPFRMRSIDAGELAKSLVIEDQNDRRRLSIIKVNALLSQLRHNLAEGQRFDGFDDCLHCWAQATIEKADEYEIARLKRFHQALTARDLQENAPGSDGNS